MKWKTNNKNHLCKSRNRLISLQGILDYHLNLAELEDRFYTLAIIYITKGEYCLLRKIFDFHSSFGIKTLCCVRKVKYKQSDSLLFGQHSTIVVCYISIAEILPLYGFQIEYKLIQFLIGFMYIFLLSVKYCYHKNINIRWYLLSDYYVRDILHLFTVRKFT